MQSLRENVNELNGANTHMHEVMTSNKASKFVNGECLLIKQLEDTYNVRDKYKEKKKNYKRDKK